MATGYSCLKSLPPEALLIAKDSDTTSSCSSIGAVWRVLHVGKLHNRQHHYNKYYYYTDTKF